MHKKIHREHYTEHRIQERQVCGGTRNAAKKNTQTCKVFTTKHHALVKHVYHFIKAIGTPKLTHGCFALKGIDDRNKNNLWPTHFAC